MPDNAVNVKYHLEACAFQWYFPFLYLMKRTFILFLYSLHSVIVTGQMHDARWLYGVNPFFPNNPEWGTSVLDFNTEPPTAYKQERPMNIDVTMASFCDSTGNLLFYTNGAWIANSAHEMMENGDSLNPGEVTWQWYEQGLPVFQSAIILPFPEHEGMYYLLHLKLDWDDLVILAVNTFYYSLIDMNQNAGLGKVALKNQELLTEQTLGTISAVKHANGRDWWVVVSNFLGYIYKVYLLSPDGIHLVSEQNLGGIPPGVFGIAGTISFSNDGTKMAQYEVPLNNVVVYDFDRCTGTISNPAKVLLPEVELGGGQAFSPNGRFFYMASSAFILQLDLWAPDIAASLDTVAVYDGFTDPFGLPTTFFAMQPGPDGRIYFNTNNATRFLHVIERPNLKGDSCRVMQRGVQLPTYNSFTSPHFSNYRLGPLDGSPCDTLGLDNHPLAGFRYEIDSLNPLLVEFIDNSFYEPTAWSWNFGDGSTSTDVNPLHTFPASGTYTVCLTVSNQYDSDTACREVEMTGPNATVQTAQAMKARVYPNPASAVLTLETRFPVNEKSEWRLLDILGRSVHVQTITKGTYSTTIHLDKMTSGVYSWVLITGGEKIQADKFIIFK